MEGRGLFIFKKIKMNPQELDALVGRRVDVIWPGKKKWEKKIEPSCSFLAWADDMMLTAQLALIYLYSFNSLSIMTNSFERLGLSRGKKKKKDKWPPADG